MLRNNKILNRSDIALIASIVIIALLFRRYDAFINPQLYAEDGRVFLQQVEAKGLASIFTPYAGYLHTVPRLIALMCSGVGYEDMPLCYNFSALLITIAVAVYIYACGKKSQLKYPVVFGTAFLFLPLDSEIYMNLTNVIWITSLAVVCFVFSYDFESDTNNNYKSVRTYAGLFLLMAISLTGPVSLLLSPVVVLMMWLERKKLSVKNAIPLLIILLSGFIQFVCIKFIDAGWDRRGIPYYKPGHFLTFLTENIRSLFFLNTPLFENVAMHTIEVVCIVLLIILALIFIRIYLKSPYKRKYVFLLAGILYISSFVAAFWPNEYNVIALYSARYYFIPYACIALIVLMAADKRIKPLHIGIYLIFISFHEPLIAFALPDKNWKSEVRNYENGISNELHINPDGWTVKLPERFHNIKRIDYSYFAPSARMEGADSTIIPLWSNNPVMSDAFELQQGKYGMSVAAKGTASLGVTPHIAVYVDGKKLGDFFVTEIVGYSPKFYFEQSDTKQVVIKLQMDNDTIIDGADRNAFIHAINISKE